MKFRNYCLVVMGNTQDVISEIIKVSENEPNILDAKGIMIGTFTSNAEPKELTDYFKLNGRSFLLFDLNEQNSGFYIAKEEINDGLFGFLKEFNTQTLKQIEEELIQEITSSTVSNVIVKNLNRVDVKTMLKDIEDMSPDDKNNLINKLIDKGIENLSEYDKSILKKLAQ